MTHELAQAEPSETKRTVSDRIRARKLANETYVPPSDKLEPPPDNGGLKRGKNYWKNQKRMLKKKMIRRPESKERLQAEFDEKRLREKGDKTREKVKMPKKPKTSKRTEAKNAMEESCCFDCQVKIVEHIRNSLSDGMMGLFDDSNSLFSLYGALYLTGGVMAKNYIKLLEDCFHLFRMMRCIVKCPDESDRKGAIVSLVLKELNNYTQKSTLQAILGYLTDLEFPFSVQADCDLAGDDFAVFFSSVKNSWQGLGDSPLCKLLYKIMSLFLSTGLCHMTDLKFSIGSLEIFNREFIPRLTNINDFVDGVLTLFESFARVGYKCFMTGSLLPLLGSDDVLTVEQRHRKLQIEVSAYTLGNLEIEHDKDDAKLESEIEELVKDLNNLILKARNPGDKRIYNSELARVNDLSILFKKYRHGGRPRVKPYTIAVVGPPGGGKSVFSDQIAEIGMAAVGEEYDRGIHYLRMDLDDKYNSMASNRIKVVLIDDMANTKDPEVNPANPFIQLANNTPFPVAQADIENKRGIELKPKLVIVTSNMMDLGANLYSNEPASVVRRPDIFVELTPHEKYCYLGTNQLDAEKVRRNYDGPDTFYKDLYSVTAYRFEVTRKNGHAKAETKRVNVLENVSYSSFLKWYATDIKRQQATQEKLLTEVKNVSLEPLCKCCSMPRHVCGCATPGFDIQADTPILDVVGRSLDVLYNFDISRFGRFVQMLPGMPEPVCKYFNLWRLLPSSFRYNTMRTILVSKRSVSLVKFVIRHFNKLFWAYLLCILMSMLCSLSFLVPPSFLILSYAYYCKLVLNEAERVSEQHRVSISTWRDWFAKDFVPYCLMGGLLLKLLPLSSILETIRTMYNVHNFEIQGTLNPQNDADVRKRDATENVWVKPVVRELPVDHKVRCTTANHLQGLCKDNLVVARCAYGGGYASVNGFFLGSNVIVLPYHFVKVAVGQKVFFAKFSFQDTGTKFTADITNRFERIPDTDLCLAWVPSSGSKKSLVDYLPEHYFDVCTPTLFTCKDTDTFRMITDKLYLEPKTVTHSQMTFEGFTGSYSENTKKGMCMGVHICNTKSPRIIAFHLGGSGNLGCMGRIKRSDYDDALFRLMQLPGVLPAGDEGVFRNERNGRKVVFSPDCHRKSAVNFVTDQNFEIFGSMQMRSHPKSNVEPTLISESVHKHTGVPNTWGPPKFTGEGVYPYQENLQKCVDNSPGMPPTDLGLACQDYLNQVLEKLDELPGLKADIRPWTTIEALSGIPGKKFCDAMALKTSAGYGLPGKKQSYVHDVMDERGLYSHRVPTDALQKEIEYVEDCWSRGERSDAIFTSSLKDEPTPTDSKKVRVFQAGPMPQYVAAKKLVGSVVRALRMINVVSETAVGTDPTSPEWEELIDHATRFGDSRVIAGDYSGYDKRLPSDVLSSAWWIIMKIAEHCGYDAQQLKEIRACSTDTVYSYQAYNGTLLRMIGSEPSGEGFTVDIDGLAGCLLMRCAFFSFLRSRGLPLVPFKSVIGLVHNGDDHIGSVHESLVGFDQIYLSDYLTKNGMKYTGTDKSKTVSEPFSYGPETEFLKRVTTCVEGLDFKVGALLEASIYKSLHSCIRSKEITREVHAAQVIMGAMREAMFHGRKFYEQLRSDLKCVANDFDLRNLCPTLEQGYDEAIELHRKKFHSTDEDKSVAPTASIDGRKAKQGVHYMDDHGNQGNSSTRSAGGFDVQMSVVFTTGSSPNKKRSMWWSVGLLATRILILRPANKQNEMHGGTVDKQGTEEKKSEVMSETAVEIMPLGSTSDENVYYHEEGTSFIAKRDDEKSMAHIIGTMDAITLATFVQRPVRIQTLSWAVGGGVETNFNPWQLYFSNPAVQDKIKNFYRMQCGLKVKFQIVGNQFNFGRLLVAYQPFVTVNGQNLNQVYPWPGVAAPFTPDNADLCLISQYPHLYLDPVNSAGGELEIPFVWFRQYFEIPTQDWLRAGSIIITTLSNLEAANGSTDPVTIQVIAQPINFSMDVPTEFEPQMAVSETVFEIQMNVIVDAASQFDPAHPISSGLGLASMGLGAMAKAKGKKKNKKARKFAKKMKTAQLATKMAGMSASRFGFTRQPNAMGTNPYVPRYGNTLALTEGTTETVPLTCYLDSQLTVSPDRFGVGNTDEMTIQAVACKEAYFNKFTWSVSDAPGTNLFGCEVTPAIWTTNTTTGMVGMTPMCFAVQPFEFWSGTITFRFQIVSSSFHKGIILIKYDPDAQATGTDLNLQTLASIDISKDRDITVEVGMSQVVPWLYHRSVIAPVTSTVNGGGNLPPYSAVGPFLNNSVPTIPQIVGDYFSNYKERLVLNGVISIQVFNTLVVPANSTATSVDVLCHASAGSDFKVAAPTDQYIRDMSFFPPPPEPGPAVAPQGPVAAASTPRDRRASAEVRPFDVQMDEKVFEIQMDVTNDPVAPSDGAPEALTIAHHFGATLPEEGQDCDMYMGECIESLRVLAHRAQFHTTVLNGINGQLSYFVDVISDFPNYAGQVPNSLNNSNVTDRVVNMTYLNYITPAYALRSGSVHNMYVIANVINQALDPGTLSIYRREKGTVEGKQAFNLDSTDEAVWVYNGNPEQGRSAGNAGMHITPRLVNPTLDNNMPYYDDLTGYPAQMTALGEGNVFCRMHAIEGQERNVISALNRYVCAGPDFQLGMFLSAPPVYQRAFTNQPPP